MIRGNTETENLMDPIIMKIKLAATFPAVSNSHTRPNRKKLNRQNASKKQLFLLLLFVSSVVFSFGQSKERTTHIYTVGVLHQGNKKFDHQTIYKLLNQYNPDIILWEQDTDFKRVFGLQTAHFLKIAKVGIEQLALQKYTRKQKKVKIFGFDTAFASKKKYIKKRIKMDELFFDSLNAIKMKPADSSMNAAYNNKINHYYNFIFDADLIRINKPDVIDMARDLYGIKQAHILSLGKKYITDSALVNKFEEELIFWEARNNYMVQQIQSFAKQFEGKRMMILTGLNHKYYLVDKLTEQENSTITIKEIENH